MIIISGEGSAADTSTADQYLTMRKEVPALTQVKDLDEVVLMTGGQGDWGREKLTPKSAQFSRSPQ